MLMGTGHFVFFFHSRPQKWWIALVLWHARAWPGPLSHAGAGSARTVKLGLDGGAVEAGAGARAVGVINGRRADDAQLLAQLDDLRVRRGAGRSRLRCGHALFDPALPGHCAVRCAPDVPCLERRIVAEDIEQKG